MGHLHDHNKASSYNRASLAEAVSCSCPPDPEEEGVTLKGCETNDMLPMNPEGAEVDATQGRGLLTNATSTEPLLAIIR